jgi:hypothetical protein
VNAHARLSAENPSGRSSRATEEDPDPGPDCFQQNGEIRDASGTVVASLCFIARKTLIQNVQRRDKLLEHLLHAAHLASMDLGWRPDPV